MKPTSEGLFASKWQATPRFYWKTLFFIKFYTPYDYIK